MDGMILPDVPFEEKAGVCIRVQRSMVWICISLIAPTSHERISMIAKEAEGFVYCVSSLGVTGMRSQITTDIGAMVDLVKAQQTISRVLLDLVSLIRSRRRRWQLRQMGLLWDRRS